MNIPYDMSENQQFCLRWNNHHSTLVSLFSSLLDSNTFADCTLVASGKQAKVHKMVLSACSPYLKDLLLEHVSSHPIIILDNVRSFELEALVEYMYCGEVNIMQEHLEGFLKAADSLQIKGLSTDKKDGSQYSDGDRYGSEVMSNDGDMYDDPSSYAGKSHGNSSDSIENQRTNDIKDLRFPLSSESPANSLVKMEKPEILHPLANSLVKMEKPEILHPLANSYQEQAHNIKSEKYDFDDDSNPTTPEPYAHPGLSPYPSPAAYFSPSYFVVNQMNSLSNHHRGESQNSLSIESPRVRKWSGGHSSDQGSEFKCEVCNKPYRSKTSLNLHKRWECGREPQFQCPFCLKKTHQKGNLKVHIMSKHRDQLNLNKSSSDSQASAVATR